MYTIFKNEFESSIFIYLSESDVSKLSEIKVNYSILCVDTSNAPLIPCLEKIK